MQRCFQGLLASLIVTGLANPCRAQSPFGPIGQNTGSPLRRPAFSPYLNLNRAGTSPGVNYYGLVRPQIETQRSIQSLQAGLQALPQDPLAGPTAGIPIAGTGHPVTFFNTSHYFTTLGGRSSTYFGPGRGSLGTGNLGSENLMLGGITVQPVIPATLGTPRR